MSRELHSLKIWLGRWMDKALGSVVRQTHLNVVAHQTIGGRLFVIKRRNFFGRCILPLANWFFDVCHVPISFWTDVRDWQRWAITTFRVLNPDFDARPIGRRGICMEILPGRSLWQHLQNQTLTARMLEAAGAELRRAHACWSDYFDGPWSHGDNAMCNILYDDSSDLARLIDFEIVHDPNLPAVQRHAEDLLSVLLDLAGFVPENLWLDYSMAFLDAYANAQVINELRSRFVLPRGIGLLWWKVRVNFVDSRLIMRRLRLLDQVLSTCGGSVEATVFAGAAPPQ